MGPCSLPATSHPRGRPSRGRSGASCRWTGVTPESTLPSRRPQVLGHAGEVRLGCGPQYPWGASFSSETSFSWEIKRMCLRSSKPEAASCVFGKSTLIVLKVCLVSECLLFAFHRKTSRVAGRWVGLGPRASAVSAGSLADDGFDWHYRPQAPQARVHAVTGVCKWQKVCWPWLAKATPRPPPACPLAWLGRALQSPGFWGRAGGCERSRHPCISACSQAWPSCCQFSLARKDFGVRLLPTVLAPGIEARPGPSLPHWSVWREGKRGVDAQSRQLARKGHCGVFPQRSHSWASGDG